MAEARWSAGNRVGVKFAEAIDLAVLKRLAEDPLAADIRGAALVRRFWEACCLPDFRQSGADTHARFVARLWHDLRQGHIGADFVAARIAELDRPQGDIDTLQGRIAAEGAVLSEYLPGTPARPGHFPARNRLVAGLALATVVVEAAQRSGALITARLAAEAGREVCALPGSVLNPRAAGCHRLIREGAALVERPEEVLELLAPALRQQLPGLQSRLGTPTEQAPPALLPARWADDPDYQCLWRALDHDPSSMDSLITRCGLTAPQVSSMLLAMELAGIVVCVHGRYCRTP